MADLKILLSEDEIKELGLTPPEDLTPLWEHWEKFIENRQKIGRSDDTLRGMYDVLRTLIKRTGICTVEEVNDFKSFRKLMWAQAEEYNWQAQTLNDAIRKIRYYLEWLHKEEYIGEVKLKKIEKHKAQAKEQSTLTREQVLIVFQHISQRMPLYAGLQYYRDLLLFQVLQLTGARNCEILDMKADAIYQDPDDGQWKLRIQGRKQKGRAKFFLVEPYLVATYNEYIARRQNHPDGLKNEALWVSAKDPDIEFSKHALKLLYRRISNEVGFKISGHRYRRFVATELARNGVDINDIKRHLGHTRLSTTELYIERSASLTAKSSSAMNIILKQAPSS